MILDGLTLTEGSTAQNLTVATGTSFPSIPNLGELFFNTTPATKGLYTYDGTIWDKVVFTSINLDTLLPSVGTAGTYKSVTTDSKGRVTAGTNPTTLAGFGIVDAQALDADLTAIAALVGTTGLLKKTAANTWTLDTSTYLIGNQTINISGDISGSGTTAIALTLPATGVSAGTYKSVTVSSKGLVTAGTNPTTLAGYGIIDAQPLDADLTSLSNLLTTGIIVRSAADTFVTRILSVSGVGLGTSNADGTAGNPTITSNATSANTASTIVARDASGNFSATQITASLFGNATTATTLAAGKTFSLSTDATGTSGSFDGSGNVTIPMTLATVNSNVGSFGSASAVPIITVNAKGLITGVSTVGVSSAGASSTLTTANDVTTAVTVYPTWTTAISGNLSYFVSDTKLSFVPSTGVLTATKFAGAHNGSVGATTPSTGAFTTLSSTSNATLGDGTTAAQLNLNLNAPLANNALINWQSAGATKWSLYRLATSNNLQLDSNVVGSVMTFNNTTGAATFGYGLAVTGAVTGTSFNSITALSSTTPIVAGAGAVGTSTTVARADHVHPLQVNISGTAGTVTTNANLTGPITSVGNATSITSQTGTGTTFVMSASPVFTGTPRTPGLFVGPDSDIYLYESATNVLAVRTGGVGTEKYFTFGADGVFSAISGGGSFVGAVTGASFNSITALSSTTPAALGVAAVGTSTTVARSDHVHLAPTTITGNAGSATNISGGGVGSLPYQSAASTTAMLAAGTNGQVLTLAAGVPSWAAAATGGATLSDDTTTNANTFYPTMASNQTSGAMTSAVVSSTKLTYNPSTGTLNSTNFNTTSDERAKDNIRDMGYGLNEVLQMSGKKFEMKDSGQTSIGLIAQDVLKVIPEVVNENGSDRLGINYPVLTAVLIEAVKELTARVAELEQRCRVL